MIHSKPGPTHSVHENDKHESHSFWFDEFKCSIKVDRRKDSAALAVTLKTPDGKVVVSLGPEQQPRLVTQVTCNKPWSDACHYSSQINEHGVKFRFDYEP
jgi:hypothetical protein